jgi:hypothetical protein
MTQLDPFATTNSVTKPADPFGQADGSAPTGDPFGSAPRPDSEFLNSNDLKPNGMAGTPGALVLIRIDNAKIETVEKPAAYGGGTQDRLSADTAALDGEHAGRTGEGVWWFNAAIVGSVKRAQKASLRCILGRLIEVPSKIEKNNAEKFGMEKGYVSEPGDLPMAYEMFKTGIRKEKPNVAVVLAEHTEEDAVKAREFLAAHPEFLR